MKDYSSFFKNPEAFIKNIKIDTQKNEIYVTFVSDGNDKTLTFPLTKELLNEFEVRLFNQYIEVVNNEKNILKSNHKTTNLVLLWIPLAFGFMFANLFKESGFSFADPVLYSMISLSVANVMGIIINERVTKKKEKETIKIYRDFITQKDHLKALYKQVPSISQTIERASTYKALEEQKKLKSAGLIKSEFNSLFMDKADIKDLKSMLEVLKIYQGLEEEVEIDTKPYTRSKKK